MNEDKEIAALKQEIADLRDAIRLIVGRKSGVPWMNVRQDEVDGYLEAIRFLKRDWKPQ